jgi:DNA replication and repair protein RecF
MRLERLALTGFRNLSQVELEPDPKLNWLIGDNGQGKTSVLEGIALLASLRSFRDSKAHDWIQADHTASELNGWLVPDAASFDQALAWRSHFRLVLDRDETGNGPVRKTATINGKKVRSGAGYLKQKFGNAELAFHTISFNPSDHDLVRGEPALRRAYLDRVISAENPGYLEKIVTYAKLVEQRNALLKEAGGRFKGILAEFTRPLIPLAAAIQSERMEWLDRNLFNIQQMVARIAPEQPAPGLCYHAKNIELGSFETQEKSNENRMLTGVHFAGHHPRPSLQVIENWLESRFAQLESEELRQGVTLLGPHRDDWWMESRGVPLKGRGSQGEIRTALLALKLGEIWSFRSATGHRPILLLDDFSSELDLRRRRFLMETVTETDLQVFVTSTEASGLPGTKFQVEAGNVNRF